MTNVRDATSGFALPTSEHDSDDGDAGIATHGGDEVRAFNSNGDVEDGKIAPHTCEAPDPIDSNLNLKQQTVDHQMP